MYGWNMIPCLLLAGLLGGLIGWLLKSLFAGNAENEIEGRVNEVESSWNTRWNTKIGEFDTLKSSFNTQSTRLTELEGSLATATASLADRDALLVDWETRYKHLQGSMANENRKDDTEIADLKARLASNDAEISSAKQRLSSKDAELATLVASVAALEIYRTSSSTKDEELAKLKATLADREDRFKKLETAALAENRKDNTEIAELKAKLEANSKLTADKDAELATVKASQADWEGRYRKMESAAIAENKKDNGEISDLKTQLAKITAELETTRQSVTSKTTEFTTLSANLADREDRYKKLEAAALAENRKDNAEIAELKTRLAQLTTELETTVKTSTTTTTEISTLRATLADREDRYKKLEAAALAENRKDNAEIAELKAQLAKLNSDKDAEFAKLNSSLSDWQGRYKTLETSAAASSKNDGEIATLKSQLTTLQGSKDSEIAKLTASVAALEVFRTQAGDWETKYKNDLSSKDSEIGKLNARISDLEMMSNTPKKPDWTDLILIEGIGDTYYKKLSDVGISWQKEMLMKGADKKGRQEIATKTGIREDLILTWVNHCDLRRVNGITEQFAELLEVAGVDTVVELATRRPDNLFTKLTEVNTEKRVAPSTPIAEEVLSWVSQAKNLGRVVTH